MQLHYQIYGKGRPLLVLHGLLGSLDNWRTVSRSLSDGFAVFGVDLRNHGRSPHSELMNYAIMARDVGQLIDRQKLGPAAVLGHSMGAKVAMQLALGCPERVEKLIVVDIAPRAYPPSDRHILNALSALDLGDYKSFGAVNQALESEIAEPALRQFLLKNLKRDTDGKFSWKIDLEAIRRNYDELTKPITATHPYQNPACFIRGGRSNYLRESDTASIREIFPRAQIKTIPEAGHWVHADAPREFSRIVRDFLAAG